jgi:hypothetical protein
MPGGRKTKLSPALQQAIITAVRSGVPYVQAALLADLPQATALEWRQRGEGRDPQRPCTPLYAQFAEALQKAEAQAEVTSLLRIRQAGEGGVVVYERTVTHPDGRIEHEVKRTVPQWQSHAWLLERRWPERYARRLQADLSLRIEAMAREVAAEIGVSVEDLMREAQLFLKEHA